MRKLVYSLDINAALILKQFAVILEVCFVAESCNRLGGNAFCKNGENLEDETKRSEKIEYKLW